jgi:hypothetical protein
MNNLDGPNKKHMLDGRFLLLMFVIGGMSFISLEVVVMGMVIMCIRIFNIRNMYVMNK